MRQICLVFLTGEDSGCLTVFERAFKEHGFEIETIKIPFLSKFDWAYVRKLQIIFKNKVREKFVIFSPQLTELFLETPHLTITYSAYRTWFDHEKMRVIPQLWNPVRPPESFDALKWTTKPPLRVGFMGRSFPHSRLANMCLRLPPQIRKWILQGSYIQHAAALGIMQNVGISTKTAGAFTRIETLAALKSAQNKNDGIELDIVEREGFLGSTREVNDYIDHLERNTYIVCPRGTQNYSHRLYETLSRGRIPVIIDTDVVLPQEIDWNDLSLRIPYGSLDKIYEIVRSDYETHSAADFVARQQRALSTMAELRTMRWVDNLVKDVGAVIESTATSRGRATIADRHGLFAKNG
jgi:hypothetical protein